MDEDSFVPPRNYWPISVMRQSLPTHKPPEPFASAALQRKTHVFSNKSRS